MTFFLKLEHKLKKAVRELEEIPCTAGYTEKMQKNPGFELKRGKRLGRNTNQVLKKRL